VTFVQQGPFITDEDLWMNGYDAIRNI